MEARNRLFHDHSLLMIVDLSPDCVPSFLCLSSWLCLRPKILVHFFICYLSAYQLYLGLRSRDRNSLPRTLNPDEPTVHCPRSV